MKINLIALEKLNEGMFPKKMTVTLDSSGGDATLKEEEGREEMGPNVALRLLTKRLQCLGGRPWTWNWGPGTVGTVSVTQRRGLWNGQSPHLETRLGPSKKGRGDECTFICFKLRIHLRYVGSRVLKQLHECAQLMLPLSSWVTLDA